MSSEPENLPDEDLMTAYQLGDERAFDVLYSRYSGKVYGFLKKRIYDKSSADDVFQATFFKLHSARSQYNQAFPFAPWLFTICRSVLTDSLRKKARTQEDLNENAIEKVAVEPPSYESDRLPDLSFLPVQQRQAIELRYGQDLSFADISKHLETSSSNVRQLISRAIRKLKDGVLENNKEEK